MRQQQEELLLKNQQQREELERSIPRPAPARPLPVSGSGPCFTIHTITLSGATLISPKTRQTLVAQAGNDLSLSGTDIRAGKSVSLSGENVLMGVSRDTRDGENHSSSAQYGVTASAGGWAVEAAKAAETAARSAENGDDPRLTAIRTGQSAATAAQGAMSDSSLIKAKVSLTAGTSSQDSRYHSTDTQGTTINAGENVSVRAGNDIAGMGVQIAGKHVALDAGRDILLSSSQNTTLSESKNSGSQFSVGVGVSLIGAQNGISVELGASQHKGKENSQSQRNTNSVVHADEQLTVNSGRDTILKGAELEGNGVVVNTGRDLTISSVQDTASYDSKQSSSGASLSLCIPPLCYGAFSGSVSASVRISPRMVRASLNRAGYSQARAALPSPPEIIPSLTAR
ncbi:TPA: hemagglutinin repeat-containing protein [Enterobacter roggenkampii]|nr:hemagglutinin repeat-containing protein [Enterobacter roggenkampii]